MAKKQGKIKKEAKKAKIPASKSKPAKSARQASGSTKPVAKNKSNNKVKTAAKNKPASNAKGKVVAKVTTKATIAKKAIAPVKKTTVNKVKQDSKPVSKSTAKPSKEKLSTTKDSKSDKPSKEKLKKLANPIESKSTKKEKAPKKVKEKPAKKRKAEDDEDEDVEIVDLWDAPEEEDEEIEFDENKPAKKSKGGRKPKGVADEDEPAIGGDDMLIEELINSTKKLKKPQPKVPKQIRTFTNPMASLVVPKTEGAKKQPKKEPKGKFELEYVIRTSAPILYEFITSPSELAEWFADHVNLHEGIFTFTWDGTEQKARLLDFKEDKFIRLQWLDKPEGTYFEFRIERDELTGDVSLLITDFADEVSDLASSKLLWDKQVDKLSHVIGSFS